MTNLNNREVTVVKQLMEHTRQSTAMFFLDYKDLAPKAEFIYSSMLVSLLAEAVALNLCTHTDYMPNEREIASLGQEMSDLLHEAIQGYVNLAVSTKDEDELEKKGN